MTDEVKSEEQRIEPYYQVQAKRLIDSLFDLGMLSESLSRDGITCVEDLVALYFQQIAQSASRCAGLSKKYKVLGGRFQKDKDDERQRHEEEMRWIARAKDAEALVAGLSIDKGKLQEENKHMKKLINADASQWTQDVVAFLRETLVPPYCVKAGVAADLLVKADEFGFTELDCRPGKGFENFTEAHRVCEVCGGRKAPQCESIHGFSRCQREMGHSGCHEYRGNGHIEQW